MCIYQLYISKNHTQKPISFQSSCSANGFKLVQKHLLRFVQMDLENDVSDISSSFFFIFFLSALDGLQSSASHQTFAIESLFDCICRYVCGNLLFWAYFKFHYACDYLIWSWNQNIGPYVSMWFIKIVSFARLLTFFLCFNAWNSP